MGSYMRQIECLNCSNCRAFVYHTDTSSMPVTQAQALTLPPGPMLTCGRCGSTSLIRTWGDATPYATRGYVGRRRRRRSADTMQEAQLQ